MIPKRSRRAQQAQGEPSQDFREVEAVDTDHFDCLEAEQRYNADLHKWSVLHEHYLYYAGSNPSIGAVVTEIRRRHWEFLIREPKEGNLSMVREFYVNYHTVEATYIHLRGKHIDVSPESIAEVLQIPLPAGKTWQDDDEFIRLRNQPTSDLLERVRARICVEGGDWHRSPTGSPTHLPSRNITLETRAWTRAVFSHIRPNSHHSEITLDDSILVYMIMEGYWLNLPKIIYTTMSKVHNGATFRSLPYPALIATMAEQAEVEEEDDDDMQGKIPKVGVTGLVQRDATERNARERGAAAVAAAREIPDIVSPPTDAPGSSSSSSFDGMCSTLMSHMDARFDRMQGELMRQFRSELRIFQRDTIRQMRALMLDPQHRDDDDE